MQIGFIGLGKMGKNMALRLLKKGYKVFAYDKNLALAIEVSLKKQGVKIADSLEKLSQSLKKPKKIWLMVPSKSVDEVLKNLMPYLKAGDAIIDGGNSFFVDSKRRAKFLEKRRINFLDVGVSGGPSGALNGACLMIGGKKEVFEENKKLFKDLSGSAGCLYAGQVGAGHFVKMVHNGIEYGMMQAIAEGFSVLKKSRMGLNLEKISEVYNQGSVIESRLVSWLKKAFKEYGEDLKSISGSAAHTGEGEWTVKIAQKIGVSVPAIRQSFLFRVLSEKKPNYTGKILSALRNQFGGHSVKSK